MLFEVVAGDFGVLLLAGVDDEDEIEDEDEDG